MLKKIYFPVVFVLGLGLIFFLSGPVLEATFKAQNFWFSRLQVILFPALLLLAYKLAGIKYARALVLVCCY